jgi:hypothetical protein
MKQLELMYILNVILTKQYSKESEALLPLFCDITQKIEQKLNLFHRDDLFKHL